MRLALFDLDNTLLGGDSDHAWGDYLCERGILDGIAYKARNDDFYQDYLAGRLNITDYLNFSLEILGRTEMAQLEQWHREFMRDCVEPIILAKGEALLAEHPGLIGELPPWHRTLLPEQAQRGAFESVRLMLQGAGLDPPRLQRVAGFADRKPVTANPAAARNNRIEVILLRRSR